MSLQIYFNVDGQPQGKARPRFKKVNNFVSVYTPAKTKTYEKEIKEAAIIAMGPLKPLETAVAVHLHMYASVPASYSKKRTKACLDGSERPTKKPDADNTAKAFLDAMNGVVYKDDAQIVYLTASKNYGVIPCVHVSVYEVLE